MITKQYLEKNFYIFFLIYLEIVANRLVYTLKKNPAKNSEKKVDQFIEKIEVLPAISEVETKKKISIN
jgi:hypothetical protein